MIHEAVEVGRWKSLFALRDLREEARRYVLDRRVHMPHEYPTLRSVDEHIARVEPGGQTVASPYHLAVVEQIREEIGAGHRVLGSVSADIFVLGRGEPARRDATKIGGLPYWPQTRPWPTDPEGEPMAFIAQFCFADSRDIVGRLPGDVLLLFAAREELGSDLNPDLLHFEWMRPGETGLVQPGNVPASLRPSPIPPYYGAIHRTRDYPGAEGYFSHYNAPERLAILAGTKIGGVPRWIQIEQGIRDRFLCSLASVRAVTNRPYPYVNDPTPLLGSREAERMSPLWGEASVLNLFLADTGKVVASVQTSDWFATDLQHRRQFLETN